ncbi:MAG: hypothetical protein AAF433_19540, partial [Bacteroidota bacterium]
QEPPPPPTYKEGHLLYQIPSKMQLQQRYQCQVRIAQQLDQLLKNLKVTKDLKTEQIPVAEVMEVEIIDPNAGSNPSFDVLLVSDAEQHVDEYSYTEWLFLVRPLKTGAHDLFIKVSVIIKVDGRTLPKNVVLNRQIEVFTEVIVETEPPLLRIEKAVSETNVPPPPAPTPPLQEPWQEVDDFENPPISPRVVTKKDNDHSTKDDQSKEGKSNTEGGVKETLDQMLEPVPPFEPAEQEYASEEEETTGEPIPPPLTEPAPVPQTKGRTSSDTRPYPWRYILGVLLVGVFGVGLVDFYQGRGTSDLFPEGYTSEAAADVPNRGPYCFSCQAEGVDKSGKKPIRRSRLLVKDCTTDALLVDLGEAPNCCLDLGSKEQRAADWLNGQSHIYELFPGPVITRMAIEERPEKSDLSGVRDTIYPR